MAGERPKAEEIPKALSERLSTVISIASPNLFGYVKGAVDRHNRETGQSVDAITVAELLKKQGYKINAIPERAVEIKPDSVGILRTKKEIAQVIADDRVAQFPVLEGAISVILRKFYTDDLAKLNEDMRELLDRKCTTEEEASKLNDVWSRPLTIKHMLKYGDAQYKNVSDSDLARLAEKVRAQIKIILSNFKKKDELESKSEKKRVATNIADWEATKKTEREARQRTLLTSREAAGNWLYGTARVTAERLGWHTDLAVQELTKNTKARDLMTRHNISINAYIDEQIREAQERYRDKGRSLAWESALSTLLLTYGRPRPPVPQSSDSSKYLLSLIEHWNSARFVSELPNGAYERAIQGAKEHENRRQSGSFRDRWDDDEVMKNLLDDDEESKKYVQAALSRYDAYRKNRAAVLWWEMPDWIKWKNMRQNIRDTVFALQRKNKNFTPRAFSEYLALTIKAIERSGDAVANASTGARSGGALLHSRARVADLKEIKERFDLDFVVSREDREKIIEQKQDERARSRRSFGFGRSLFGDDDDF